MDDIQGGIYTVQVQFTDRSRNPDRSFVVYTSNVVVMADTDNDALYTAFCIVYCIRDKVSDPYSGCIIDGMVIGTQIIDLIV